MVKIRQSPSQDVFNYFYNLSQEWGYNTFEFLPPVENDVEYPFVQIGEVGEVPGNTKTELTGAITLTINCWGTYKQRLAISEMVERFFMPRLAELIPATTRITDKFNSNQNRLSLIPAFQTQRLCVES